MPYIILELFWKFFKSLLNYKFFCIIYSVVDFNPNSTNPTGFQPKKKFNPVENVGWIPKNFQSRLKIWVAIFNPVEQKFSTRLKFFFRFQPRVESKKIFNPGWKFGLQSSTQVVTGLKLSSLIRRVRKILIFLFLSLYFSWEIDC